GTSTVSRTRVGLRVSTALFTIVDLLGDRARDNPGAAARRSQDWQLGTTRGTARSRRARGSVRQGPADAPVRVIVDRPVSSVATTAVPSGSCGAPLGPRHCRGPRAGGTPGRRGWAPSSRGEGI